jgi:Kelch motif
MTTTENQLADALRARAGDYSASPDLAATLVRGRRIRRRRHGFSAAAGIVVVAAVTTVALQVSAAPESATSGRIQPTMAAIAASPLTARARSAQLSIGSDVYIWGGSRSSVTDGGHHIGPLTGQGDGLTSDGAVYHAATNTWQMLAPSPLTPRVDAAAVEVGGKMLVLGGTALVGAALDVVPEGVGVPRYLRDGAMYDPAADSWQPIPPAPLCVDQVSVVGEVVFAGGTNCSPSDARPAFASYQPATREWTSLASPDWTLSDLLSYDDTVVAEGIDGQLATYTASAGGWLPMADVPSSPALGLLFASDGHALVALAGSNSPNAGNEVYSFEGGSWHRVARFHQGHNTSFDPAKDQLTVEDGELVWHEDRNLIWLSLSTGRHGSVDVYGSSGSIEDPALSAPMPVGAGRFVFWGGRDLGVFPGSSRPLSAGAVLTVRR